MTKALTQYMPDAYKRVARMIGYTLLLGKDADNWNGLSVVLSARLTVEERAAIAWAALRSLDGETATATYQAAILPPPQTAMEQAAIEYRHRRGRSVSSVVNMRRAAA
tara:strand:+ start:220 stop:543 length:324 start_codon:yes stop_codon:yes gene_type:complete